MSSCWKSARTFTNILINDQSKKCRWPLGRGAVVVSSCSTRVEPWSIRDKENNWLVQVHKSLNSATVECQGMNIWVGHRCVIKDAGVRGRDNLGLIQNIFKCHVSRVTRPGLRPGIKLSDIWHRFNYKNDLQWLLNSFSYTLPRALWYFLRCHLWHN